MTLLPEPRTPLAMSHDPTHRNFFGGRTPVFHTHLRHRKFFEGRILLTSIGSFALQNKKKQDFMANLTHSENIHRNRNNYSINKKSFLPSEILFQGDISIEREKKIKEIKSMLGNFAKDSLECLIMIDALQQLGVDYHFKEEVQEILHHQFSKCMYIYFTDCDLFEVSTRFRILRQEGYNVPTDIFNKLIDKKGKFMPELSKDIRGLMSFYEASQLCIDGEKVVDQAADLCAQFLNESIPYLDHDQAESVTNTLQYPYHKSFAKFTSKNLLREGKQKWVEALQELAKMEFDMIHEPIHKKELLQVFRWWKEMGVAKELKFIRNQPLKWYVWTLSTLTDPSLSEERIQLTKSISFVYIIDDIFDVYGTLEDLTLFTEAVNRWELHDLELPEYMNICFKALDDVTNEISDEIYQKYGWNPINSLQKAWGSLCNAFLVEARWFSSGEIPKAEEYLKNGIISSGVQVILTHMYFILGGGIDEEGVKKIENFSELVNSTATILRLWDDLGSAKDENQDGKDGSYMEYYMKENKGCTVENARNHVMEMISKSWKSLNKEYLSESPFSKTFKKACLNGAKMVSLMYSYDKKQRLPLLEEYMKSIHINVNDIGNI